MRCSDEARSFVVRLRHGCFCCVCDYVVKKESISAGKIEGGSEKKVEEKRERVMGEVEEKSWLPESMRGDCRIHSEHSSVCAEP